MVLLARSPLRAFRSRDYALYWGASVLSIVSHLMFFIFRGWLALELTDSPFMVTAVATAGELPSFILSMPGGVLADRISRKAILIGAEVATIIALAAFALLIALDQMTVWLLFLLTALLGSAFAVGIPSRAAIVPNLVAREDMANAVALSSIMFSGGTLVGPAAAGWLLDGFGAPVALLTAAAISGASIALLVPVRTGQVRRVGDKSLMSVLTDTIEGAIYLVRHRVVLGLMVIAFVAIVAGSPYQTVLPVFARDILEAGALGLGILGATGGAGAILASLTVAAFNGQTALRIYILLGSLGFGAFVIAFALSTAFWFSAAMALGAGCAFQIVLVATTAQVQMLIADEMRGRIAAVRSMSWGAAPLGFLVLGTLAEQLGTPVATAAMGVVTLIGALVVIVGFPALRSARFDSADAAIQSRTEA